jgi:hypothetical protein
VIVAGHRRRSLVARLEREAATLAHLTGWDIAAIKEKVRVNGQK